MDLKGKDSVPEYVHHVVFRVSAERAGQDGGPQSKKAKRGGSGEGDQSMELCAEGEGLQGAALPQPPPLRDVAVFTDNVHSSSPLQQKGSALVDRRSQSIKELKQKILLDIVDKFEVSANRYMFLSLIRPLRARMI